MSKVCLNNVKATFIAIIVCFFWIFFGKLLLASEISSHEAFLELRLHNSEVIYQSPLYFCGKHEDMSTLFIRSDLGNVPVVNFGLESSEEQSLEDCKNAALQLSTLMGTKGVRFLTAWESDGNYDIKISESEGYSTDPKENKYYLFTLKLEDDPEVMKQLKGIASTYGGEIIIHDAVFLTPVNSNEQKLHDSEVIYQSPLYFCDEHEDMSTLFIRSDLGNVPVVAFRLGGSEEDSPEDCADVALRLSELTKTKGVRFLTWWDKPDGSYDVKISESEGYAIDNDKHYLFNLKAESNPGAVVQALRGIASTYGGEAVVN